MNGYFEEINKSKYLRLVPTNESKEKITDLIKSMTKNSYDCDEKYMKIKSNSDDGLPLNKMTYKRLSSTNFTWSILEYFVLNFNRGIRNLEDEKFITTWFEKETKKGQSVQKTWDS